MHRKTWDVFISYASEDKSRFVQGLAEELRHSGFRVWYDEFCLVAGDSLRESIDRGIADAYVGVIVLSPNFFKKSWPRNELNALFSLSVNEGSRLIPIWLDVGAQDVSHYSPMLADRKAIPANQGLSDIKEEIMSALWTKKREHLNRDVWAHTVRIDGALRDVISPVNATSMFEDGWALANQAIFGVLRQPINSGGDFVPGNFVQNMAFGHFLHELIATEMPKSEHVRREAEAQRDGYIYMMDGRTPDPQGEVPPEDILGAIAVQHGALVPHSYQRNFRHRLLTWDGFFMLPEHMERRMMSLIYKSCAEWNAAESEMKVELDEPLP